MLINHELPMALMKDNVKINDYDFVLYHLYISNPEYKQYYLDMRKNEPDRLMILDNSAYELYVKGEKLDLGKYTEVIRELQPDYHIVPDTLMDKDETMSQFNTWITHIQNMEYFDKYNQIEWKTKPMFVPQGKTFHDFMTCYKEMVSIMSQFGYDAMAIPFHNDFFYEMGEFYINDYVDHIVKLLEPYKTTDARYAIGRCRVMDILEEWNTKHDINIGFHLLGSHDPIEFKYLSKFDRVISADTSFPVKLAFSGDTMNMYYTKPDTIIDSLLDAEVTSSIRKRIKINVDWIKDLIK